MSYASRLTAATARGSFKPTTLYIKIHLTTWERYCGKTSIYQTFNDVHRYTGSGVRWKRILKKYGKNYSTVIIGHYTDPLECERMALHFSALNDIANSADWANIVPENGFDGGDTNTGKTRTLEMRQRISEGIKKSHSREDVKLKMRLAKLGPKNPRFGKTLSDESRQKISESLKGKLSGSKHPNWGKTLSDETKDKIRKKMSGPDSPNFGRIMSEETKRKISKALKGKKYKTKKTNV